MISKPVPLGEEDHTLGDDQPEPMLMEDGGERLHCPWRQLAQRVPAILSERRP